MGLKASKHNFFFDAYDGYVLAYNAFSNSFARVSSEEFNLIKNLIDDPNNPSYSAEIYERFRNDLKKDSFLVDEILDELEILKMLYKIGRFSQDFLGYIPICVGGCPYLSLKNPENPNCTNFKYNLEEMLRLKYFELKSKKIQIKKGG